MGTPWKRMTEEQRKRRVMLRRIRERENPELRERRLTRQRDKYQTRYHHDPEFRARELQRLGLMYHQDPEFRERQLVRNRQWRAKHTKTAEEAARAKVAEDSRKKRKRALRHQLYLCNRQDPAFMAKQRQYGRDRAIAKALLVVSAVSAAVTARRKVSQ